MIPVTKPFLPPIDEYNFYVRGIWERNVLTNNGPLVRELEVRLKEYLNVPEMLFLGNGTIALQIAIKALGLHGEIITTPFSFVATTSSIVWEGCTPVFVDIDPLTLNIDPEKIEAAITSRTSAILATHVYGNPCDIDGIEKIAKLHNLKVIYDAAHGFGTKYKGQSIFSYGDIAIASFHATKLFHTIEGGAVFAADPDLNMRMSYMRNFGHDGPEKFNGVGINGKNSEFHAAMGLTNLPYVESIIRQRKVLAETYDTILRWEGLRKPILTDKTSAYNYAYYPVVFEEHKTLMEALSLLNKNNIFPRRYFYPSLEKLPYVTRYELPITDSVSNSVICLPLYHELKIDEIELIGDLISETL